MNPKCPFRPAFRFLLGAMLACGFYLCLVTAWLWPFLIVWSVSRRFWRRPSPPPLPPIIGEAPGRAEFPVHDGEDAFAA